MSNEKIRQDVLTYMESHATHPVSYDDLGRDLRYKGKGLGALWTEIELMIKDGLLVKTRFNTLGLPRAMGLVTGRLQVTQKGYGFVVPLEKTEEGDLFIPAMHLSGAMNEDLVIARVSDHGYGGRREERSSVFWSGPMNVLSGLLRAVGILALLPLITAILDRISM